MKTLHIDDLQHAGDLHAHTMSRISGGENRQPTLPKEKPIKLTYVNGDIIGTWANGTTMSIPMD